ncbi:MAG TPA: ABC transporter ATP-binding protein [Pyrinomonadaceae bacterium]|nr:ABC transporter ATP-binding protein [Pyrinomonadaceae bacterium]
MLSPFMRSTAITTLDEQQRSVKGELRVSNLWKAFLSRTGKRVEVLRGVSFSASAGEAVAITGASGAGKSTLLHLVGGLEAPDRGTSRMTQGEGPGPEAEAAAHESIPSPRPQTDCQVGFIFQFHHLLADLNALENVALPLRIARVSCAETERRAAICLQELGLAQLFNQRIGDLSGGEQQRVAVARALIGNPSLVLADEPTGNLDTSIGDEIGRSLIDYCHRRQAIVVIATHNVRLAQLCDRVLLLNEGKLQGVA